MSERPTTESSLGPETGKIRPGNSSTTNRPTSVFAYRSLIWIFATRDLKSRFKGTALGWVWSFLVPLATVIIYSLVFSVIIRVQPPPFGNGDEGVYAVWLLVGMAPWAFISNAIMVGIPSLLGTGPLMQKVYVPSFVPVIAAVVAICLQSAIELGIIAVILLVLGNVGWTWLLIPFWAVLLVTTTIAFAYSLAVLNVHWRDLSQIIAVLLQMLFFLSPVIYPLTIVPEYFHGLPVRTIMELNPITQFILVARELLYDLTVPSLFQAGYLIAWTIGGLFLARTVFHRWGQDIGESI